MTILIGSFVLSSVSAKAETLDVKTFLPLFERNSIARKILNMNYSLTYKENQSGQMNSSKRNVHLVFDAERGTYREEVKYYDDPSNEDLYKFYVNMWNGEEFVTWVRPVSKESGVRSLGSGIYEYPGHATIYNQPFTETPSSVAFFTNMKAIAGRNPKLVDITRDTISIETKRNKFEFSKKTGALKKLDYYNSKMTIWKTYEFSNHVEHSEIWMPLQIMIIGRELDGSVWYTTEISIDPETLRILDEIDNPSIFKETLPAGCVVNDTIRKQSYIVTTADTLPNDVEALKKTLEKMLEQAQEQAEAVEKEAAEKKKK